MDYRHMAALVLVAAAGCGGTRERYMSSYQSSNAATYSGVVPAMDSSRMITEQDCSKAFDPFRGNLRCK